MSERTYRRLLFWTAVIVLLVRCAVAPKKASTPLSIRGNTPHLELRTETYNPAQYEFVDVTAEVVGDFGKGNTVCLTPEWLVTAVGVPFVAPEQCGKEMVFHHPYRFRFDGEYEIVVTLKYPSGAIFGIKSIKIQVGG